MATFIVDCPECKAKVAAEEKGRTERTVFDQEMGEPFGTRVLLGICPQCKLIIAGRSFQRAFKGFDSEYDDWADVVRVYPDPARTFTSDRIPKTVTHSLEDGDKCIQAGAHMAACVMLGRALEGMCRDLLADPKNPAPKKMMLGQGIKELKAKNIIDQRLFDWSQDLQAFRNIAAHPDSDGPPISREDAEDLQAFVHAIIEYVYDLTDRYEQFKKRIARRPKKKGP
jgi:hypothetical protein